NILGLSSGFVIAILILLYVRFEQSYESYNPNAENVVRVTLDYLDGETLVDQDCETYHVLGPMIKDEFPEVVDFTRAYRFAFGFELNGKVFKEPTVYAVDPSFLPMFGYKLLHGDPKTVLTEVRQIVLTESAAIKYFGKTDVVGETIPLNEKSSAVIAGVVEDSPANTHFKFNLLVSYISMKSNIDKRESPWNMNDTFTYLQLKDADSYPVFKKNLVKLSNRLREEDHTPDERIISQKIEDIHLYSDKSYEAEQNGSATLVFFLLGVALLVIIIAILNYINLSTAKAMDRAKEAGIRKVVGSSVTQLRIRFFIESVMLNVFAGILAIGVIWLVFDAYKNLAGLPQDLQILNDLTTWYLLGGLLLTSTFLSGIFPAFALGSFKPLAFLKGKFTHSKRGIFMRKALVTLQFSIAIFLLIQTFTANEQLKFMLNKDLGMNAEKVVVIGAPPPEGQKKSFDSFRNTLLDRPTFQRVGLSSTVPGLPTSSMGSTTNIQLEEETRELKNNFYIYQIDSSFISTMEMEMIAGNDFTKILNYEHPIIINEEALRIWGIADPEQVINKKSTFWGRSNTIIGVVKDFHQLGAKSAQIPMIFMNYAKEPDYISVRISQGSVLQQVEELEQIYLEHFPASTFEFFFLDQNFDAQYRADQQFQQIFSVLSGFAILITCLGLFGLASFTIAKRTKEIGIRKVLGASVSHIVGILSKDFIVLVAISSIIALPLTYLLVERWLNQYSFRIEMDLWLFLFPILFVLLVAFA
ncbi:MAG: ABC transporter permease, partial [Bacteroidota bacterium]